MTLVSDAALLEDAKSCFVRAPRTRGRLAWPAVNLTPLPDDLVKDPLQLKDFRLSRELAAAFKAKEGYCYRYAFMALLYSAGLPVTYVEGWAVIEESVTAHGWLELAGRVIDPTWAYHGITDTTYFAGLRLTLPEALAAWQRSERLPLVASYGRDGLDYPGYSRAHDYALACAQPVTCDGCAEWQLCEDEDGDRPCYRQKEKGQAFLPGLGDTARARLCEG